VLTAIGRTLPATRHRDFRFLWGGSACSSISLWTLLLANGYIVFKLSDSSLWVGVATFASMSPFLLAPIGGMVADRIERRYLVRSTRLATFGVTVVLFGLAATDLLEVWMVVVMAGLQGLVRSVEIPSDQALLANVVPEEDRANAVALTSTTQHGSRAVGPLLAGPLLATIGVEGAYGISALMALIAFMTVRRVQTRSRGGVARLADVAENLRVGWRYVRATGAVFALFVLVFAHCALTMSFDAMLPGFAETELHRPKGGLTMMNLGVGVGALVGTFVLSAAPAIRSGQLFLLTAVVSGVSPILMLWAHHMEHAAVVAILMGSSQAMFMAMSAVMLQAVVPDEVRGRVMSLYLMSTGGIMAVANLGFGSLADVTGSPVLFALPGVAFVAIVAASLATGPHIRRMYVQGTLRAAPAPAT
jgi:MFS family permease